MKDKSKAEKFAEVLKKRFISEEMRQATAKFDLNTELFLIAWVDFGPEAKEDGYEHIRKLAEVFDASEDFKTDVFWDALLAESADFNVVSKNGYLYVRYDGFWDVNYTYSSELTREFVRDIRRAFENYFKCKMSCRIDNKAFESGPALFIEPRARSVKRKLSRFIKRIFK